MDDFQLLAKKKMDLCFFGQRPGKRSLVILPSPRPSKRKPLPAVPYPLHLPLSNGHASRRAGVASLPRSLRHPSNWEITSNFARWCRDVAGHTPGKLKDLEKKNLKWKERSYRILIWMWGYIPKKLCRHKAKQRSGWSQVTRSHCSKPSKRSVSLFLPTPWLPTSSKWWPESRLHWSKMISESSIFSLRQQPSDQSSSMSWPNTFPATAKL